MRILARAASTALLLAFFLIRPAFGHALYERSTPPSGGQLETPGQIQVWFTEEVEASFSEIQVLDGSRRRVDNGDTRPVPGEPRSLIVSVGSLPDGTYTVSWRNLSAVDGHVIRGTFPLVVGAGGLSGTLEEAPAFVPNPGNVASRWLGYLAALTLAGGFIFRVAVFGPALSRPERRRERSGLLRQYATRFRRLGLVAAAALVAASLVGMAFQAADAADVPVWQAIGEPFGRLLGTRLGLLWEARLGLGAVLALLLWQARGRALWWGGALLGTALLLTISLNSHAAALPSATWFAVATDWLHQIAAAAWVGGLFTFALVALPIVRTLKPPTMTQVLAPLVARFSSLAVVSVVVLALTGAFHAWMQVSSLPAFDTYYGWSLIAKLLLLAPMLGLGAANLVLARPRLAELAATKGRKLAASVPEPIRRFQWAIVAEVALAIGVLVATASLTATEPAREAYARQPRPIELAGTVEELGLTLALTPGRPGPNSIVARLTDATGQLPEDVQRVTLRFTYLDQDLGSGNLVLEPRDDGSFGALASNLSTEGEWQIEAIVRRRGREDARTGFRIQVASPETAGQPPSLDASLLPAWFDPRRLPALGLAALGLGFAVWVRRARGIPRRQRQIFTAAGFAIMLFGGVLFMRAGEPPAVASDARAMRNPFAPDSASIARGRTVYEEAACASCHGVSGRGDGPLSVNLRPRPADLRVHMEAGHTDGELFTWISQGIPGTAMPAYEGQLSEADRWHVINYIRGFATLPE